MHTREITGRWWEFTPKVTKITKELPRKQRVYLTDIALELIGVTDGKEYIFPSAITHKDKGGNIIPTPITERAVSGALRRNLASHIVKPKPATWKKATKKSAPRKKQFVVPDDIKLTIEKFTPHDLRRTTATLISELKFSDSVVDAILAHLKKGEIRIYNKNKYDKEKQQALEAWERKLNSVINVTESGKVIPIARKVA
jgi:integrase